MTSFFRSYPFLGFGLWTCFVLCFALLVIAIIDKRGEMETRGQVDALFILGGIGGLMVINLHGDFFAPKMLFELLRVGNFHIDFDAFIFGGSFLTLVSLLPLVWSGQRYAPQIQKTVSREKKLLVLLAPFVAGGAIYALGGNSIGVASAAFAFGGYAIIWWRKDLCEIALKGAVLSMVSYGVLLLSYLALLHWNAVDVGSLALAYSPYYAEWSPALRIPAVGFSLAVWSFTFGLMFGPFWPFMTNKDVVCSDHPYRHELNDDDPVSSGFGLPSVSSSDDPD